MSSSTVVRIRLRFNDVDTFVEKFAPNVTRGGLFLATRNVRPVGETISFELLLADGSLAFGGEGKITWTKAPDPAQPAKPFGMGVQFLSLRPESKPVLARLLKTKETLKEAAKDGRPAITGAHPILEGGGSRPLGTGPHTTTAAMGVESAVPASAMSPTEGGQVAGRPLGIAKIDPHVDLGLEMGLDEPVLREMASRLRMALRSADPSEALEELLKPGPEEPATLEKALADLPRLLAGTGRRRSTGGFRPVESPHEITSVSEKNGHDGPREAAMNDAAASGAAASSAPANPAAAHEGQEPLVSAIS